MKIEIGPPKSKKNKTHVAVTPPTSIRYVTVSFTQAGVEAQKGRKT
jgi:hypothetical protein